MMDGAPSLAAATLIAVRVGRAPSLAGELQGAQYSSARMIVSTRVVTAGSVGSGEPNSVARS